MLAEAALEASFYLPRWFVQFLLRAEYMVWLEPRPNRSRCPLDIFFEVAFFASRGLKTASVLGWHSKNENCHAPQERMGCIELEIELRQVFAGLYMW